MGEQNQTSKTKKPAKPKAKPKQKPTYVKSEYISLSIVSTQSLSLEERESHISVAGVSAPAAALRLIDIYNLCI
ncbi:hypothetical protein L1887_08361 [Cichorium endivia]|nr:hypothetical protein L1887_08361 [Cichorium endivia]